MSLAAPLRSILENRGINDIEGFIAEPKWSDLPSPLSVPGVDAAASEILESVLNGDPIGIFGDYDCDGISATVIMGTVLRMLGAKPLAVLPDRSDGYGLTNAAVHRFSKAGIRLLITVDNGIAAGPSIRLARRLGMHTVVIDHHTKSDDPEATVVWTPDFCGAALSLLTAWAILSLAIRQDAIKATSATRVVKALSTLAAIGSIADCVPLVGATRTLTRLGLQALMATRNAGLRRLMLMAGVRGRPSASSIAFGIAPRINAAGRLGHPSLVLEMLESRDPVSAAATATRLDSLNKERRAIERRLLAEMIESTPDPVRFAYVGYYPNWPKGLAGILAARAAEHFDVPSFILVNDTDGSVTGSGRSVSNFNLVESLRSCADLLTKFGGHQQAAGVTLPVANVSSFREHLAAQVAAHQWEPAPASTPEATLSLSDVVAFRQDLHLLEPFGIGNPPLRLQVDQIRIVDHKKGRVILSDGRSRLLCFTRQIDVPANYNGSVVIDLDSCAASIKALA